MRLSIQHAQEIVMEIGNIVGQNINLMDTNGEIIASTDPNRIGTLHSGALRMVSERIEELYISEQNSDSTTRPGLNLAVKDGPDIVGVVGISGDYNSVYGYGQIVRKMTEILIRERSEEVTRLTDRRIYHRFLEEWVLENGQNTGGHDFAERGLALGINIALPRRVIVASPFIVSQSDWEHKQHVSAQLEQIISTLPNVHTFRYVDRQIILIYDQENQGVMEFVSQLQKRVRNAFQLELVIGCDGGDRDTAVAYRQAERAWQAAHLFPGRVCSYRDLSVELFVDEISPHSKQEFIHKVFRSQDDAFIATWMPLVEIYFQCDGSLQKASAQLYIHKNTLQHRIIKLMELTGYDLRRPSDAVILYLAYTFFRLLSQGK